ncbi:MAG: hypothetical protein JJU05_18380 [Verrucomicrobia bacterium]|nr:hypothetical protein [Verrucomicrobiota bacterium]MCH8529110.1 hypothetical protein [Kiritimatiellia bacterium]
MSISVPRWKQVLGWVLFFGLVLIVILLRYRWFRELQTGWFEHLQAQ